MKKKILSIALALLLCLATIVPTFADDSSDTPPERAAITASYGLEHVSGSTYKIWVILNNPQQVSVSIALVLYDATHSSVTSVGTTSSDIMIMLTKNVSLSSGTYYLRLVYTANYSTHAFEKQYTI